MTKNSLFFSKRWENTSIRLLVIDMVGARLFEPEHIVTQMWQDATGMRIETERVPVNRAYETIKTMFEAGNVPYDAVMMPSTYTAEFAGRKWIQPLNALMQKDRRAWREFNDKAVLSSLESACSVDDEWYLMPTLLNVPMIVYRRDWAEQAGIERLSVPTTIEDFVTVASRLHAPPHRYGTHLPRSSHDLRWIFVPALQENGAITVTDSGTYTIDDDKLFELLSQIKALAATISDTSNLDPVVKHQIGITCDWSWRILQSLKAHEATHLPEYDFTYFPQPYGTSWSFGLPTNGSNHAATVAYLMWAGSKDNDRLFGFLCGCPVRQTTYESKASSFAMPWYKTQYDAAQEMQSISADLAQNEGFSVIGDVLHDLIFQELEIEVALKRMKAITKQEAS